MFNKAFYQQPRMECVLHADSSKSVAISKPKKKVLRIILAFVLAILIAFSASSPAKAATGDDIASIAQSYLGYPYAYGAAGPDYFDCSGFVWYIYHQAGVDFRLRVGSSSLAANNTKITSISALEPGDICFFGYGSYISHWGIYVGDGNIVHAYNYGLGVVTTPVTSVSPSFSYACRIDTLEPSLALEEESSYLTDLIAKSTVQAPMRMKHEIEEQLIPLVAQ